MGNRGMKNCAYVIVPLFAMMFAVAYAATPARAATYYVATDGQDSNPGTLASPWRTIQHAADNASAGATIFVRGGTYKEQVKVTKGGDEAHYTSFENYAGELPVIDSGLTQEFGFMILSTQYIRVKGFEIRNCKANAAAPNPYLHVAGIGVYSSSDVTIEENFIHNIIGGGRSQSFGIIVLASSGGGFLVQRNTVSFINGFEATYGIWTWAANGAIIRNNLVFLCDKEGIRLTTQSYAHPPVVLSGAPNIVEGNICIHNAEGLHLNMAYAQPGKLIVQNNFCAWNWGLGLQVKHTKNAIIRHNTIYKNGDFGMDFHGTGGSLDIYEQNDGLIITDNLMSENRVGILVKAYKGYPPETFDETVDYNCYFCPGHSILGVFADTYPAEPLYYTPQEYGAASSERPALDHKHTPYEQHGRRDNTSPFQAPDKFDFRLNATTPAKAMADDGQDAGALESGLAGVGVGGKYSLSNIPDLHQLPLAVVSFSSETASGRAVGAVDADDRTYWEIDTAKDTAREIVLALPGTDAHSLYAFVLSKEYLTHNYFYNKFELYVDDGSGSWRPVAAPPEHPFVSCKGEFNGEAWMLPEQPKARRVKVKIIDGCGPVIRIPDIRFYGE